MYYIEDISKSLFLFVQTKKRKTTCSIISKATLLILCFNPIYEFLSDQFFGTCIWRFLEMLIMN